MDEALRILANELDEALTALRDGKSDPLAAIEDVSTKLSELANSPGDLTLYYVGHAADEAKGVPVLPDECEYFLGPFDSVESAESCKDYNGGQLWEVQARVFWNTFASAEQGVFTEQGTIIDNAGDVGGDIQASDSYERRWMKSNGDGTFTVVEFYCYLAVEDEIYTNPRTTPWIQTQVTYIICTDPDDPGTTEEHSDSRYWEAPVEDGLTPRDHCLSLTIDDVQTAVDQMGN